MVIFFRSLALNRLVRLAQRATAKESRLVFKTRKNLTYIIFAI